MAVLKKLKEQIGLGDDGKVTKNNKKKKSKKPAPNPLSCKKKSKIPFSKKS